MADPGLDPCLRAGESGSDGVDRGEPGLDPSGSGPASRAALLLECTQITR
jgi:hypothetical protein